MSLVDRFGAYAAAFEDFYKSDDASALEPYFTEGAVYETIALPPFAGVQEGRDAVFRHLKSSLDGFDRRFDSRELELLEGPQDRDGAVWIRWRGTYRVAGAPPMVIEGEETATFDGDRISRLEDRFNDDSARGALAWFEEHGGKLKTV